VPITVPPACLNAPKANHLDQDLERAGHESLSAALKDAAAGIEPIERPPGEADF
jgi:hypothetical protein